MNNNIIDKIQKETNYSFIKIISLIIKDNFKYGVNIDEYYEYKFYKLDDKYKSSYMTSKRNKRLIKKYNDKNLIYKIKNRNILYNMFSEYIKRKYMLLDDTNILEFKKFLKGKEKITVRKIDGYESEDISLSNRKAERLYLALFDNNVRLVEECIKENSLLKKFNFKSKFTINYIIFKNKIIQETIKYDKKYYIIIDGKFKNKKIPYIDDIRSIVKKINNDLKGLDYLYYEFTVSSKGIELISVNESVPIIQNEEVIVGNKSYALKIKE